VQHIAEEFVPDCGEEAEVAVHHPFEAGCFVAGVNERGADCRQPASPFHPEASMLQHGCVGIGGSLHRRLAMMETIDVVGKAWTGTGE
jgi:hypothetical protein